MLTSGHCGNATWYSYNYAGITGNSGSNLFQSSNVDSQVLYGQSYTNQTWVGSAAGTSTLPASGYVGLPSVVNGGQYLFSGGASGQGTVTVYSVPNAGNTYNCFSSSLGTACHLIKFSTPDSICYRGDSGAPVTLYSPGTGSLVAVGVHTAGGGLAPGYRDCRATSIHTIVYAYGGATIG